MENSDAVKALAALAQSSRLDVYRLLVQAGTAGLPAGAIGEQLSLPGSTLSFHLNQLQQAGLIGSRRVGRSLIYDARYDRMNELLGYLTENCCQGDSAGCDSVACDVSVCDVSVCDVATGDVATGEPLVALTTSNTGSNDDV